MSPLPSLFGADRQPARSTAGQTIVDHTKMNYYNAFPDEAEAKKVLSSVMIINQPMSTVGGDGYWLERQGDGVFLVVFDCMGHGSLASMMTRIYLNSIRQAIVEEELTDPARILEAIHFKIRKRFEGKKAIIGTGADMAVIHIPDNTNKFEFCSARMDLVNVSRGNVARIRANRRPVGEYFDVKRSYETIEVSAHFGAKFFVYSDGLTDLFGGPQGKKFGFNNLKSLLLEVDQQPLAKAKSTINERLDRWAGANDRLDDLLLIGFER